MCTRVCVVVVFVGQIYTDWANHYLAKSGHKRLIRDLQTDVTDGVLLADIIQVVGESRTHAHVRAQTHTFLTSRAFILEKKSTI